MNRSGAVVAAVLGVMLAANLAMTAWLLVRGNREGRAPASGGPAAPKETVTLEAKLASVTVACDGMEPGDPPIPVYLESQWIGFSPRTEPLAVAEGKYRFLALRTLASSQSWVPPAPFVLRSADAEIPALGAQEVRIDARPSENMGARSTARALRAYMSGMLRDKSAAEKLQSFWESARHLRDELARTEAALERARHDPLVQQLTNYYGTLLQSSPVRRRLLFRGVPGAHGHGQSVPLRVDVELDARMIRHLAAWLSHHHELRVMKTSLDSTIDWIRDLQTVMQAVGDERAITAAWALATDFGSLRAEAAALAASVEQTGENLAALLERVP